MPAPGPGWTRDRHGIGWIRPGARVGKDGLPERAEDHATDEPDAPVVPLAPGELVSMLVGNGSVAESDLPAASRADLAAYRVARTAPGAPPVAADMPAAEQAARALAGLVHRLARIADSPESDPAEVTAAMNQLRQIAAGHDPGAADTRTAPELTRAELQRIARGGLPEER